MSSSRPSACRSPPDWQEAAARQWTTRFSARRGTYRVIYRIDDKDRVVTVVDRAPRRRDIYRTSAACSSRFAE